MKMVVLTTPAGTEYVTERFALLRPPLGDVLGLVVGPHCTLPQDCPSVPCRFGAPHTPHAYRAGRCPGRSCEPRAA
jgi:hypothetical protein